MSDDPKFGPVPRVALEWVSGKLVCGQCSAPTGWGRWQEMPDNVPPGMRHNVLIDVPRPVVYCSRECVDAAEVRIAQDQRTHSPFPDVIDEVSLVDRPIHGHRTLIFKKTDL